MSNPKRNKAMADKKGFTALKKSRWYTNLKDIYVEWMDDEYILKLITQMNFPADMTLHIPKDTGELYEEKGLGIYNIEEYTQ